MLRQIQAVNPSIKASTRLYASIHSIDAFSFHYTVSHNDRDTTVLIVCLVAYKRGYVLTYNCVSSFYRRLKALADIMILSFTVQPTEEDLFTHVVTYSNPLSIQWTETTVGCCRLLIPSHWSTVIKENQFLQSTCSTYEDHFFSITLLLLNLHTVFFSILLY